MLGIQEWKDAGEQVRQTAVEIRGAVDDARAVLRVAVGIAEDVRAITTAVRRLVLREPSGS